MKTVLVRYKTSDDKANENEALIRAVFDELRAARLAGIRYACYKLQDGVSFVHLATIDTPDGSNPLPNLDSFKRFQQNLRARCIEVPVAVDLSPVDAYSHTS
jgi:hypothetical protein